MIKESTNYQKIKFAKTLLNLMECHKLNAKDLSIKTGIPRTTISEWLGDRMPKLSHDILNLAKYFNVSLDFLLTGEEKIKNQFQVSNNTDKNFALEGEFRIIIEKIKSKNRDD